ncbi:MAG: sulfatase-like hydrolase/transferase [Candidatus Latescibacteria bacterium]|jgi:arylsulfatase A-like enzyme|nr:sulfatase-like hydrolase/transferase [Candidatus Latescibacterota bacterium]
MSKRPNVVVLMSDQQRLDTVSCYGRNDICKTPNIDALAARGVRFDAAFTPTAICSPARASFYTGLYPHKHGVTANGLCIDEGVRGVNHYLAEAGYRCGYAGKWHVDEETGPTSYGFIGQDFMGYAFPGSDLLPGLQFGAKPRGHNPYADYLKERGFDPPPAVSHRYVGTNPSNQAQEMFALHEGPVESCIEYFVAEEANRVLDQLASGDEPFFLWANFWGPHSPSLVPEPYFSLYNPRDIPEHPGYAETFAGKPYRQQLIEKLWGLGDYGWEGFQEIGARYFGHCTLLDDMVGRVVAHLEKLGVLDNTIIVYTADHGDCMGAHRLIEKGEFMYDEIYRIPLVIAHPECQAPGTACNEFVYLQEIMLSALDAAGLAVPDALDGASFLPAIEGKPYHNGREEVYCVFDRHFTVANQRMVRTRTHQFTFNSGDPGELYDLAEDPYQLDNRYGDPAYEDVRQDLIRRMDSYMSELNDPLRGWFARIKGAY